MKVKALIKAMTKSKKVSFGDTYNDNHVIIIDGVFVPHSKAREDKRKVDTFYVVGNEDSKYLSLNINTIYIKEATCDAFVKKKKEKKEDKKHDKDKKKKK